MNKVWRSEPGLIPSAAHVGQHVEVGRSEMVGRQMIGPPVVHQSAVRGARRDRQKDLGRAPDPGSSPPASPLQSTVSVLGTVGTSGNDRPRRKISSVIADLSGLSCPALSGSSRVRERYSSSSWSSDQSASGRSRFSSTLPSRLGDDPLPAYLAPKPTKTWRQMRPLGTRIEPRRLVGSQQRRLSHWEFSYEVEMTPTPRFRSLSGTTKFRAFVFAR